jgi:hypothetical protein
VGTTRSDSLPEGCYHWDDICEEMKISLGYKSRYSYQYILFRVVVPVDTYDHCVRIVTDPGCKVSLSLLIGAPIDANAARGSRDLQFRSLQHVVLM